ncbi:MAG: hypothetical protein ACFFCO_08640, partial [Promethearchaeota archaeon]
DIAPLLNIGFLVVLSIISIILALRMRAVRDNFLPLVLIIIAVLIILRSGFISLTAVGGVLILIGAILVLVART